LNGQELHLKFAGTIDGDKLQGAFSDDSGSYATTGERQPKG